MINYVFFFFQFGPFGAISWHSEIGVTDVDDGPNTVAGAGISAERHCQRGGFRTLEKKKKTFFIILIQFESMFFYVFFWFIFF